MFYAGKGESGKFAYVPKKHFHAHFYSGKGMHATAMKHEMLHMMEEMKEKKAPHNSLEKSK